MFRKQLFARLSILGLILLLIDIYAFQSLKVLMRHAAPLWRICTYSLYWGSTIVTLSLIAYITFAGYDRLSYNARIYIVTFIFIAYLLKLIVAVFLLINDIIRAFRWLAGMVIHNNGATSASGGISRLEFLNTAGWLVGGFMAGLLIKGLSNIDRYRVRRVVLKYPNLPAHAEGMKFVQVSDIHTGSYTSTTPLREAVEVINKLEADAIFFTGDLVNSHSEEALPYIDELKQMKAKMGVYSITGNHDYGDYHDWPTEADKEKDVRNLFDIHRRLGWRLLVDEHVYLDDEKQVALIGVQNISGMARFHSYGNFAKAIAGSEDSTFRILLSHDPTHWDSEVSIHPYNVDLTLAGHTHGMQFGINIPGYIKWSPASWVFKHWMGLYNEGKRYLYVNTGLGYIGYPGRVGILPEITVFELKRG